MTDFDFDIAKRAITLAGAPESRKTLQVAEDNLKQIVTAFKDTIHKAKEQGSVDALESAMENFGENLEDFRERFSQILEIGQELAENLYKVKERIDSGDVSALLDLPFMDLPPEARPYLEREVQRLEAEKGAPMTWDALMERDTFIHLIKTTARDTFDATGNASVLVYFVDIPSGAIPAIQKGLTRKAAERGKPYTLEEVLQDGGKVLKDCLKTPRGKKEAPGFSGGYEFILTPSTRSAVLLKQLMDLGGSTSRMKENLLPIAKRKSGVQVGKMDKNDAIQVKGDRAETTLEVISGSKIQSRSARRIYLYVMDKIYQRLFYTGALNGYKLEIPLREFVDDGLYSTIPNARRAFWESTGAMQGIRLTATVKKGETVITTGRAAVLFPTMEISNNVAQIYLNEQIEWTPILNFFTVLPRNCFQLSDNALDMEFYIFTQARQHSREIKEKGFFNVSLKALALFMDLPIEDKKNPRRNIAKRLEDAAAEIMKSLDPEKFKILFRADFTAPREEYLEGYAQIYMKGEYSENLKGIATTKRKKIEIETAKAETRKNEGKPRDGRKATE